MPPVSEPAAASPETQPSKNISDNQDNEEDKEQALVASFTRSLTLESREIDREPSPFPQSILASSLTAQEARIVELYRIPKPLETYELHFLLRDYQHLGYRIKTFDSSNKDTIFIVFKTSEDGKFFS